MIIKMMNQNILVPIDFSDVSATAITTAAYLAANNHMQISLLYISQQNHKGDATTELEQFAKAKLPGNADLQYVVRQGDVIREIVDACNGGAYTTMIIGSHGFKGLREKLFGADILKILKQIDIPALVVQKETIIPPGGFRELVFPVGAHAEMQHQIDAVIDFARILSLRVHLFTVKKPGTVLSDQIKANLQSASEGFEKTAIPYLRKQETPETFSVGYARAILDYASRHPGAIISIMASPAQEHFYIADADKIAILTNNAALPVLSVK
ncbi:MAG: universal stress protein [Clostridia bacterium]|nr:universal stress protein [Clostridia bacterium]